MAETPAAWRGDEQADYLSYQLVRLARTVLVEHFDDDAPAQETYRNWVRKESRRKGGGAPMMLQQWDADEENGTVALHAQPRVNAFTVTVTHENFSAEVAVRYDLDIEDLESAAVRQFQGNIAQTIKAADWWFQELFDIGLEDSDFESDDFDDADFNAMPGILGRKGRAANEPPPETGEDRRRVERMARMLRRRVRDDVPPPLSDADRIWLIGKPRSLVQILDGAATAARAMPRDTALFIAWLAMLDYVLEQIRYEADRGQVWALEMLEDHQNRLAALTADDSVGHEEMLALVTALKHAKIPVRADVSEALIRHAPALPDNFSPDQSLDDTIRPLIDEMVRKVDSPFEVIDVLAETAAVLPPALRSFIAHELALSPHEVMRETVPLMVLDADAEVRRDAGHALEQHAETLSPQSLRRAITLRNWIPEADRPPLDQAIRKARSKGVQPAPWPKPAEPTLRASFLDGSGTQSLLFIGRSGKTALFAGLMLKQTQGIADAWCNPATPRREIASSLGEIQREVMAPEVDRELIELLVQHAIARNVAAGTPPEPALLEIAEAAGATDWKDRALDIAAATERLFSELPAEQCTPAAIAASLQRSGNWLDKEQIVYSWFEDDAETREALEASKASNLVTAGRDLLDGVIETRRGVWAERFLLTALWARAVKPGQPPALGTATRGMTWRDLVVLSQALLSGRPLREVPVMVQIAERSVVAAQINRW